MALAPKSRSGVRGKQAAEIDRGSPGPAKLSQLHAIAPVLRALDAALEVAVQSAQSAWGSSSASERFRGLYIGQADIERALHFEPGAPPVELVGHLNLPVQACPTLAKLQEMYFLSSFDLSALAIALAPEVDLKYERLYAYLQDDVTRKRPTVDLVLNLLSNSAEEKLNNRRRFAPESPLLRQRIVHLVADPNYVQPPLLAHYLTLDQQMVRMLLGDPGLDDRLVSFCRFEDTCMAPDYAVPETSMRAALAELVRAAGRQEKEQGLILHFRGVSRAEMHQAARTLAHDCGVRLLTADLSEIKNGQASLDQIIALVLREARSNNAVPYLEAAESSHRTSIGRAMRECAGTVIVASQAKGVYLKPEGIRTISIDFSSPDAKGRQASWESGARKEGVVIDPGTLETLSSRFRLTLEQITQAVEESCASAQWRTAQERSDLNELGLRNPLPHELYAAARAQSGADLATIARKLEPIYTWDDLVLPVDTTSQLHEICQRVNRREHVFGRWGFDRKLSLGKGTSVLFAGPSGTGKTMAAEVIANEVMLDLYTVDLAGVVSKYIGETEKNLDRIFAAAEGSNAILFFDEADALFGKRSEVRDSHDRYANLEISYLLQKMEAYEGVTILASNLRQHMDDSFIRRLAFTVLFPFPDETHRLRIWRGIWPGETPLASDLDFSSIANRFKLSGGNIKNVALAAAFLAAADGGVVGSSHLLHAIEREYQKMGKTVRANERIAEAERLVMS